MWRKNLRHVSGVTGPPPRTYAQGVTEHRHDIAAGPDGSGSHSNVSGHLENHPRWIAIPPSNARRVVLIILTAVVLLRVATWAFAATSGFLFLLLLGRPRAIAMEPVVLSLSERGLRRGVATGFTLIGMLVVLAGLLELFGSVFISQLSQLGTQLPKVITSTITWINQTFHTEFNQNDIESALGLTPDKIGELAGRYGGGLLGVFGSLLAFLFDSLTILVFAYYFSADSPRLRQTIGSWLPQRYQRVFITVWTTSVEKTGGYVVSKLVLAAISSFAHATFFWAIDVPFWLPLGVFAGIVGQFIPTIGTYLGVILPALFALLDKPINAVWIAVFATVYQQLENYVFTPRISRRTMDIHPAVALGSVIAGAALFGPIGALIGIPVAAVALSVLDTFSKRHELVPELADLETPPDGAGGEDEPAATEQSAHADTDATPDASRT